MIVPSQTPSARRSDNVVCIDFANKFDSVSHWALLAKTEAFDQCEKLVRWIKSYLTGRISIIQWREEPSQGTWVKIRVSQGPVIGSFLSLFFNNNSPTADQETN